MAEPAISIILPAYNSMQFIGQTIESLLNQTFTNFELLIINDGSTDGTELIIRSYTDNRIRYIKNEVNSGLVYTLNKGIELSRGKYIARMDADDIALPQRLAKQHQWLEQRPLTSVVGTLISFIDLDNHVTGHWKLDKQNTTYKAMYHTMPRENCLAHPAVMLRTEVVKKYKYALYQQHIEDYDLWLRMLSDGVVFEKVPEVLLQYRVHPQSITKTKLQSSNPFFKQFHCKRKFLYHQISNKKAGLFELNVFIFMLANLVVGVAKEIKKKVRK